MEADRDDNLEVGREVCEVMKEVSGEGKVETREGGWRLIRRRPEDPKA